MRRLFLDLEKGNPLFLNVDLELRGAGLDLILEAFGERVFVLHHDDDFLSLETTAQFKDYESNLQEWLALIDDVCKQHQEIWNALDRSLDVGLDIENDPLRLTIPQDLVDQISDVVDRVVWTIYPPELQKEVGLTRYDHRATIDEQLSVRFIRYDEMDEMRNLRIVPQGRETFTPTPRPKHKDASWWRKHVMSGDAGFWTIRDQTDIDRIVGSVCLFGFDKDGDGSVEIGVEILSPDDYGKRFASRALRWLIEQTRQDRSSLSARIVEGNVDSVALFENLGFTYRETEQPKETNLLVYTLKL